MSEQAPQTLTDFERYNNSELLLFVHGSNEAAEEIAYALDDGEERDRAELEKVFRGLAAIAILQDRWLPNPENDPTLSSSRKGLAGELRGAETLEELKDAAEFYTSEKFDDEILERPVPVFEKDNIRTRFSHRLKAQEPKTDQTESAETSTTTPSEKAHLSIRRRRGVPTRELNLITKETEKERIYIPINLPTLKDSNERFASGQRAAQRKKLKAQETEIVIKAQKGDVAAMQQLMEIHAGGIKSLLLKRLFAARERLREIDMDDLVQAAYIGFMAGVKGYNVDDKRAALFTYVRSAVLRDIDRELDNSSSTIKIPVHVQQDIRTFSGYEQQLKDTLRREPTRAEIADAMGILEPKVEKLQIYHAERNSVSLDEDFDPEANPHFFDFENFDEAVFDDPKIEDEGYRWYAPEHSDLDDVEGLAIKRTLGSEAIGMLQDSELSYQEQKILVLRYGLIDETPRTLEEVGVHFGLTRERIRQIEARALSKLRNPKNLGTFGNLFD